MPQQLISWPARVRNETPEGRLRVPSASVLGLRSARLPTARSPAASGRVQLANRCGCEQDHATVRYAASHRLRRYLPEVHVVPANARAAITQRCRVPPSALKRRPGEAECFARAPGMGGESSTSCDAAQAVPPVRPASRCQHPRYLLPHVPLWSRSRRPEAQRCPTCQWRTASSPTAPTRRTR